MSSATMETWDIVVVLAYFVCVIGVGVFAMCRAQRGTLSGYFLAGRSMLWLPVGASLFVSNIGSEHFIGLAGSGAADGISVGAWEFNAILLIQLLTWVFLPVYIACGTYTMPEYLSRRFGGRRLRVYFAILSLVLYIFTKCSVDLYTGGLFIQQSLNLDLYVCIIVLILITAVLTITGGLTAVMYTDTLQAIIMVAGALWLMRIGFNVIGGIEGLYTKYPMAEPKIKVPNTTCHRVGSESFRMLRDIDNDYMPWLGFLFGQTPGSIWYWCADQVIVQRALAAKSISHAKGAGLMAGFIKILPLFIMVMPGMISRILYPNEVACVDPDICYQTCQSYAGCSNIAYPRLVMGLMPTGLRGLMMAVMVAALMSDLDSIFNSASTLFTMDVWKRFRKHASVRELMVVGRVFIIAMTITAVAWVPVVKETQGGQVFIYIQEVTNYLAPPFAMIFLLGVLVPRVNEQGAFWGLMAALVMGVTRLILVFIFPGPGRCGEADTRPNMIRDFHYMYFSLLLFGTTGLVAVIVSLFTKRPDLKLLDRTTFWTRLQPRAQNQSPDAVYDPTDDASSRASGYSNQGLEVMDKAAISRDSLGSLTQDITIFHTGSDPISSRDPVSKDQRGDDKVTVRERIINILCGLTLTYEDEEKRRETEEHLAKVSDLEQDPIAKWFLRIGLVVILVIGVFLYVFWSVWSHQHAMEVCGENLDKCRPDSITVLNITRDAHA